MNKGLKRTVTHAEIPEEIKKFWRGDGRKPEPYHPYNEPEKCPECDEPFSRRVPSECICFKPMHIYIPPGQHIHIKCPVHGDKKIYGSRLT